VDLELAKEPKVTAFKDSSISLTFLLEIFSEKNEKPQDLSMGRPLRNILSMERLFPAKLQ